MCGAERRAQAAGYLGQGCDFLFVQSAAEPRVHAGLDALLMTDHLADDAHFDRSVQIGPVRHWSWYVAVDSRASGNLYQVSA